MCSSFLLQVTQCSGDQGELRPLPISWPLPGITSLDLILTDDNDIHIMHPSIDVTIIILSYLDLFSESPIFHYLDSFSMEAM